MVVPVTITNQTSDLINKIKQKGTDNAWANAGTKEGIEIWRIENFKPVKSDTLKNGAVTFFSGDSYIVLHTYKRTPSSSALSWNLHFWLGETTSQDESGTAAYKTVELDDLLGGGPVQFREVQGHESAAFLTLFSKFIVVSGGIESGFNKVKPTEYRPRLLHLKGKRGNLVTKQVELKCSSLNSGDVFVLDAGLTLYTWIGSKASIAEKAKATELITHIQQERDGKAKSIVLDESTCDHDEFWKLLGGKGPIKSAEEGGDDQNLKSSFSKKLLRLSDATGKLTFEEVAFGALPRSKLDSNDVFIVDTESEVLVWVGQGASKEEKKQALQYAQDYLAKAGRPAFLPISRVSEGSETTFFNSVFDLSK